MCFVGTYFLVSYLKFSNLELNVDALTSPSLEIEVYDNEGKILDDENNFNSKYVKI